jgi:hypothetical protein
MSTEQYLNHAGADLRSAVVSMPVPDLRTRDTRTRAVLAFTGGLIAVLAIAIPLYLTQLRGPSDSPLVSPTASSTTTIGNTSTIVVDSTATSIDDTATPAVGTTAPSATPEFLVTDLGTVGPNPDSVPSLGSNVDEVIQSTGSTFDTPPGFFADAIALDGRVVAVGGNETRGAEIWYSDGGEWVSADIEFPDGAPPTFGEDEGDYRLADGVTNLDLIGDTLVAWQTIQFMTSSPNSEGDGFEPVSAGTIIIHSTDGASWTGTIAGQMFSTLVPWGHGAVATSWSEEDGNGAYIATALWSGDFTSWVEVADLGSGIPYLTEVNGEGMIISLAVPESRVREDGTILYGPGSTTRQVSLTPSP